MYKPRQDEEPRKPPKYVNSPESPIYIKGETVFGLYQARRDARELGEAIIVEGNFDVVALHGRGLCNVVAPLGTAFTASQAKLIKRYAPTMVVLFDGDSAGRKATAAARGPAKEAGLSLKVAALPDGSDPDDYAREKGIDAVRALVDNAGGMLEYLIKSTLQGDLGLEKQQARVRRVVELIAGEDDPNARAMAKMYADRISSHIVVDGRSANDLRGLEALLSKALRQAGARSARA